MGKQHAAAFQMLANRMTKAKTDYMGFRSLTVAHSGYAAYLIRRFLHACTWKWRKEFLFIYVFNHSGKQHIQKPFTGETNKQTNVFKSNLNYFLRKTYNGEYELSDTSLFPIIKTHSATYGRFIAAKEGSDKGQRKRNTGEERALHYQGTANLDKVRHGHFVK